MSVKKMTITKNCRYKAIMLLALAMLVTAFWITTDPVEAKTPSKYVWKESVAPNYVVTIGKAKVSKKPAKGKIRYSKLDKYGRTQRVVGNITYKMVKRSAGWREDFAEGSDPAGWGNNRIVKIRLYNGRYYRGFLWNRSHLIADSLGGHAIRKNLITGTRMQNVGANDGKGGMAYTERKVVSYLYKHHRVSVYYSAKPVYKGKELLPRSVIVDIRSSDKKLNERVIVYNAAKGYKINYKRGIATSTKPADHDDGDTDSDPGDDSDQDTSTGARLYILNTNTMKFHYPDCSSVDQMSEKNKQEETATREAIIAMGYSPCGNCKP